jgi:hypothetical protein
MFLSKHLLTSVKENVNENILIEEVHNGKKHGFTKKIPILRAIL